MSRIIYQTDEGGVAVIIPTPQALETMTIQPDRGEGRAHG